MTADDLRSAISPIEEIIEDARNGRMFILVDHEDRENEGDLVIPAQMATPEAINFMAKHGRGLICLAMTGERLDKLGLPMMAASNQSRHETAFTTSIEAREGVTTGISAHDRARTIAVAIDPQSGPQDIATPGHVFPLRAREGGVLVRAGHTEAAVDVARLAGLNPSGVICEIMNDDGTMARLPDLVEFARKHGLKIGAISDLIAYRRRHDHLVRETAVRPVRSLHGGDWLLHVFTNELDGAEHLALTKGDLSDGGPVMVRMHVENPIDDLFAIHPERHGQLQGAMRMIAAEGRGAVVLLRPRAPGALTAQVLGRDGHAAGALREYGVGAQILGALGVAEMILLTNSPAPKVIGLEGYGLSIVRTQPIASKED
ncbi:3,4-dihydroxy-2-butanone-4-phosphate synthase [Oceanicella actignis]|uniref:3,4-dihydroxy-2-butanone 4-phosphate synthase n=1 Tax=Oceanicella actignis TaxID=1189325 RepID=A0A1M7U062_9RHOB|nr:3,4-dihydroxy-2-butanone-4-phosphate synthase [Oceanicella actignis]TYO85013.1 3,4-dihydroxy 2-butanone 4-phosphate synthase/GTP cyclohydrolase II [Oceanicella actignis]SET84246.1 3,4-dihydroxy 2-butanone 4-phosphate synthase / GTP cyclohydrolase II [Oceanicella actignis]SHN76432.1 3,4-dihydroxy 2-butanone 4-phosphate synthase / GTP cyclohydrolase II [Oceanicella actignis]